MRKSIIGLLLFAFSFQLSLFSLIGCGTIQLKQPEQDFITQRICVRVGAAIAEQYPDATAQLVSVAEAVLMATQTAADLNQTIKDELLPKIKDELLRGDIEAFLGFIEIRGPTITEEEQKTINAAISGFLEGVQRFRGSTVQGLTVNPEP